MKNFLFFIWDILKIIIIALAIVIPIRYFLFQPFFVKGQSMEPNFAEGDYLIIDEISYRLREPERGEIIIFRYPRDPSQRFIKRIIALPGEKVEIKDNIVKIYNDDKEEILQEEYLSSSTYTGGDVNVQLKEKEYFVLGDNRDFSLDSRKIGPVPLENIIGRVYLRAWPFSDFEKIQAPAY
jgi:signal peptidase I